MNWSPKMGSSPTGDTIDAIPGHGWWEPEHGAFDGEIFAKLEGKRDGYRARAAGKQLLYFLGIDQRLYGQLSTMFGGATATRTSCDVSADGNWFPPVDVDADDRSELEEMLEMAAIKVSRLASPAGSEDTVYRVGMS